MLFVLLTLCVAAHCSVASGQEAAGRSEYKDLWVQQPKTVALGPPDLLQAVDTGPVALEAPVQDCAVEDDRLLVRLPDVVTGQTESSICCDCGPDACVSKPLVPRWVFQADALWLTSEGIDYAPGVRLLLRRRIGERSAIEALYSGPHTWNREASSFSDSLEWHQAELNFRQLLGRRFSMLIGVRYWRMDYDVSATRTEYRRVLYRNGYYSYYRSVPVTVHEWGYAEGDALAMQLGADWTLPIGERVELELFGKGALQGEGWNWKCHYPNDIRDGISDYVVLFDGGITGEVRLTSRLRLRGGYQCLLQHFQGHSGVTVFHGPLIGLKWGGP